MVIRRRYYFREIDLRLFFSILADLVSFGFIVFATQAILVISSIDMLRSPTGWVIEAVTQSSVVLLCIIEAAVSQGTIGMRIMSIKIVGVGDRKTSLLQQMSRIMLSAIILPLQIFRIFTRENCQRRTIIDQLCRTQIKIRKARRRYHRRGFEIVLL